MTLLLVAMTDHVVIQASDRRFTKYTVPTTYTDEENKAVNYACEALFSFTGMAYLSGRRVDRWIAEQLADTEDFGSIMRLLQDRLAAELATLPRNGPYRKRWGPLIVVCNGWNISPAGHGFYSYPWLAVVTNADPVTGNLLSPDGRTVTVAQLATAQNLAGRIAAHAKPFLVVHSFGQEVSPRELTNLARNLRSVIEHKTGLFPAARLLVETIRTTARENESVGHEVMVASLPAVTAFRSKHTREAIFLSPFANGAPFLHFPADPSGEVIHGLTFTAPGVAASDLKYTSHPDGSTAIDVNVMRAQSDPKHRHLGTVMLMPSRAPAYAWNYLDDIHVVATAHPPKVAGRVTMKFSGQGPEKTDEDAQA